MLRWWSSSQRVVHDLLRLFHDRVQVRLALEALSVNLVDVFGAGGPGGKPAVGR